MKLFLIRHAEAVDIVSGSEMIDDYRYITANGRKVTQEAAKKLKDDLSPLDIIYTSPLVRAVQTAEVIASCIKYKKDIVVAPELAFSATVAKIVYLLHTSAEYTTVALVGHEPTMSVITGALTEKKNLDFKKSGVCCIDFDTVSERGKFEWFFDPGKMGKSL